MKIKNDIDISPKIEKKEGNNIDEIKSALQIFQKEEDLKFTESQDKPKEPEPQGVTPPIKRNIKVMVIPCDNIITKNEEKDLSYTEQDFNMELEANDYTQELLNDNGELKEESKEANNMNIENGQGISNNNTSINANGDATKENNDALISENPAPPIKKEEEIKDKSNQIIPGNNPINENKESNIAIDSSIQKDEINPQIITENINNITQNKVEEIKNEQNISQDNKNSNNNQIVNEITPKEESNQTIKDNQSQITNNETEHNLNIIKEEASQNKEQNLLADAIGSVINNHLTQIQNEEIKNFFGLKSDEEVKKLLEQSNISNNSNDASIHPGSPSLSQLTGTSKTPGNDYHDDFIEQLKKTLPKRSLIGLPNKEYFITKYVNNYNNILYNPYDYKYQDVKGDGNGGYRCIALQLLGNEDFHNDIRMDVYNFLHHNLGNFTHLTFQIEGKEVTAEEYIENIKNPGFEMGDLELYVINLIYNAILFIFQLKDEDELTLIHIKGNMKNTNCILLTICIVDEDHFNVIYEKYRSPELPYKEKNKLNIDMNSIINNTLITDINIAYELNYAADNRKYRYKDMINYMISKKFNREPTYPDFIYDIKTKQLRTNKKKEFKKSLKNYFIDEKTKRLKVKFNFSKVKELINKEFFIPFQIEKIKLIKHLHESATHKGEILSELVKKSDYWWYGIYQDVKNSVNFCPLCKKKPKTKMMKPRPFLNKNVVPSSSEDTTPS